MNNIENNQLDSSLKESAANFELPFNEAAWNLMNQKLNSEFGNNNKKKPLIWFSITAVCVAFLGFYLYNNNSAKNVAENKIEQKSNRLNLYIINKEQNNLNDLKTNDKGIKNDTINANDDADINNLKNKGIELNKSIHYQNSNNLFIKNKSQEKIKISKLNIENHINTNNTVFNNLDNKNLENEQKTLDEAINKANSVKAKHTETAKPNSHNTETVSKSVSTIYGVKNSNSKSIANYNSIQMHNRFLPKFKLAEIEAAKIPKPDLSLYEPYPIKLMTVYPEIPLPSRWYIGGNIASNISYSSRPRIADLKMGYNFILGFNVSNEVSFQTGFGYGNKQFELKSNQLIYEGPNLVWNKYIRGAYVDVSVLEIPISIRYQFSEKPNTGFFCTAGISKLFFAKENYTLNLDYGTGSPVYKSLDFEKKTTDFTMFNASLGYQFPINKYFTLTAEQYIQLPTKILEVYLCECPQLAYNLVLNTI
ncbi:MAG: hypothetical protein NTZ59_10530 [Bacteroidetes bacterium]|nr:hypothetical protein [Bacteroidota bacterium]